MKLTSSGTAAAAAAVAALSCLPSICAAAEPITIAKPSDDYAQDLLRQSLTFMDQLYDRQAGYLYRFDTALLHDTRSSSWYATGLLARNENDGDDVAQAIKILGNIIAPQFTNASEQWFGTYQTYAEQPYPGTETYPAVMYNTWDPSMPFFLCVVIPNIYTPLKH